MLTLYQFPISHYCEKIRWTLAYKQLDHKVKNLLPGLHALTTTKLAKQSSVPVLLDDDRVIQGSSSIITYLDEKFPGKNLTPENDELKDQALAWEKYVDEEIGIHVRRCCYHVLLEHPDIVIGFLSQDGPWYGKLFLTYKFPKLKVAMRERMKITQESAQQSREHLRLAIDKVYARLQENEFLVGDQFSRADLAAASLLAPFCRPAKYGLNWPDEFPGPLQELVNEFQEKIEWVHGVYTKFR